MAATPPLIAFADRWQLDGDYLRCRACERPQIVALALHTFRHAASCPHENLAGQRPWVTLHSLIGSQIARAALPAEETPAPADDRR